MTDRSADPGARERFAPMMGRAPARSGGIEVVGLEMTYTDTAVPVPALRGVDLSIAPGELCAILGPSGCGKTTLLHLLAGLQTPTAGSVRVGDVDVYSLSLDEAARWRRRNLGMVHQFFYLMPSLTVAQNVATPLLLDGKRLRDVRERACALLDELGLSKRRGNAIAELSGGEMQRVAIARALIAEPDFLLADEPTGNLDSRTGGEILTTLEKLSVERGITTVVVTHDRSISAHTDRVITMRDGRIADAGSP